MNVREIKFSPDLKMVSKVCLLSKQDFMYTHIHRINFVLPKGKDKKDFVRLLVSLFLKII